MHDSKRSIAVDWRVIMQVERKLERIGSLRSFLLVNGLDPIATMDFSAKRSDTAFVHSERIQSVRTLSMEMSKIGLEQCLDKMAASLVKV